MFGIPNLSTRERKPTVGVLTSGGDCPGLNAVIAGVVRSSEQLGYDVIGFQQGYEGLVPADGIGSPDYVRLSSQQLHGLVRCGGTILGSTNQGRFCAVRGESTRVELAPELLIGVRQTVESLGLCGLVCIGGDGSLAVALQFHEHGIPVVGVPKTIDNDLSATAFTFGFDSAVACATEALDRLHTTADSHGRVMVMEVMGRHAGWIALHSGIAGAADIILLSEIDWTFESVCQAIEQGKQRGRRSTIIVVAEGARLPDGGHVHSERRREDRQTRLGGIGPTIAAELADRTGAETRSMVLGHLQRGGSPTAFDRVLASQLGVQAVQLIHTHRFGRMVCYQPPTIGDVLIEEAIGRLNRVDSHSSALFTARRLGISLGDTPLKISPGSVTPELPVTQELPGQLAPSWGTVQINLVGNPAGDSSLPGALGDSPICR